MTEDSMSMDLRLAAIIALLSSSVLRGLSAGKTEALCAHLEAAVSEAAPDPCLKRTLEEVLACWKASGFLSDAGCVDGQMSPCFSQMLH